MRLITLKTPSNNEIQIQISRQVLDQLAALAARSRLSLDDYLLRLLRDLFP